MMLSNHVHRTWVIDRSKEHDVSAEVRLESNYESAEETQRKLAPKSGPHLGVVTLTDVIYCFSPWHNWSR